ncbi:MAG: ABC transporter ATP-binding protein [Bacillota bacterium]|nr:ABC transporter ATP-binding protein [Bacillota bacterium]NLU54505.1 ABC transporter ATP-binding protein [Bacillota bacterium]HOA92044.1 ABC transporter ATP-binding protein [Bacillota bacterium]HPT62195.1 ABC transporter ATP-binding protein [Bacillota bacterium]HPZ74124.1 ABC transporter ATP-binding protein [Bacillota bacterium]
MLKINNLHVYYGQIHALKGISLEVKSGEIVTLIGGNGAGKTTTLRTISGLLTPKEGEIVYQGKSTENLKAHELVASGLIHVPEGRHVFPQMSVQENLDLGAYTRKDAQNIAEDLEQVFELFPRLKERRSQAAGTLSGGEQQMLAMARALMGRPKLLLLDEPSMGLAPLLVREIFNIITEINKTGVTILLVEQNANMALSVAQRGYVIETGKVVLEGDSASLAANEAVRKAYLGG